MVDMLEFFLVMVRTGSQVGALASLDLEIRADLLHNLPKCLMTPDFEEEDYRWLKYDAASYEAKEWNSEMMRKFFMKKIKLLRKLSTSGDRVGLDKMPAEDV